MSCDGVGEEHPVNRLRTWLAREAPADAYPAGGAPVANPFHGTAFFTAGAGLVVEDRSDPQPPTWPTPGTALMLIGNNVDSVANFERRRRMDAPHGGPDHIMDTWKGVWQLLDLADVPPRRCFFTNCYVGLVEGAAVGRHPAAEDSEFRDLCWRFLRLQFELLEPAAVAVLGSHARDFLADHVPELATWRRAAVSGIRPGDDNAVIEAEVISGRSAAFTLLVHPSNYVRKPHFMEKWRGVRDASVEAALVRQALGGAGISEAASHG